MSEATMFDLTHPLATDIPRFPGDPEVRIASLDGFAPWQVSSLSMGTHSGTHMDAPRHRFADGNGIGSYGPERLVGRGLIIDARGSKDNEAIPASVLDGVRDRVWPGWFALFWTGWDRHWRDERYFRHPYLSEDLAENLVALGAGLVAIDTLSVDSTANAGMSAHTILLGADILIVENICRLGELPRGQILTYAFLPLALGEADGSPVRVVAWQAP